MNLTEQITAAVQYAEAAWGLAVEPVSAGEAGGVPWVCVNTGEATPYVILDTPPRSVPTPLSLGDGLTAEWMAADVMDTLTASAPAQARAPKGTPIGGQWIDTPQTLMMGLSSGERPGPFEAGSPDAAQALSDYDEHIDGLTNDQFRDTPIGASDVLARAYAYTGYDKTRPTVVEAIEHGPDAMYRGTAPGWAYDESGAGHDVLATDITDDFRDGDHWAGRGIHGDGSYFARNTNDPDKAWLVGNNYAGDTDGAVLRAQWKPEARVLTFNSDYERQEWDRLNIEATHGSQAAMNTGVAASILGYDGIRVGQGGGGWYEVILNRGAVNVQADDVPVREEWL